MTSKAFEAALKAPDTHSANVQLHKLVAAADYSGTSLPRVAEDLLRAFCNQTYSNTRRRWAGLAFAGMLNASTEVVKHFKIVEQQLQGLGEVIIGTDEREETRIIAGIVIREALAQGFESASFWSSDKARNRAPVFPGGFDPKWMDKFQTFMDNLGALALANPVTDPCILYAVSLEASNGFRWAHPNGAMLVSIIQIDALTIILPDDLSHAVQFLDIPVARIQSTKTRASAPLADSQARTTTHEPWDLVLTLNNVGWTHLLNSAKSKASQITVLFEKSDDARECEAALKELQGATSGAGSASRKSLMMSSSSLSDICLTSPQHERKSASWSQSEASIAHQPTVTKQQSQTTRRKVVRNKPSSPTSPGRAVRGGSDLAERKQDGARGSHDSVQARTTRFRRDVQSPKEAMESELPRQAQTQTANSKSYALSSTSRGSRRVTQGSRNPEDSLLGSDRLLSSAYPTRISSRDITYSQGKLPKVSHATKQRASQQLPEQSDVFEMPKENNTKPGPRNEVGKGGGRSTQSITRTTKSTAATNTEPASQGRQTRSKRKADPDQDFVPNRPIAGKSGTKRKDSTTTADSTERPSKKTRVEAKPLAQADSQDEGGLSQLQHVEAKEPVKVRRMQRSSKPKESHEPPSSIFSTRMPLIGGLLGVQKPSQASTAAFKKPSPPPRSPLPQSTPSQRRSQPPLPTMRPRTPITRDAFQNSAMPVISSSPPPITMTGKESTNARHRITETEILSSNSKPMPASPHAESTAISGHADRDDIDLEKVEAELQIAKLDPFAQPRDSSRSTSFVRRLTGDDMHVGRAGTVKASSQKLPIDLNEVPSFGDEGPVLKAINQPHLPTRSTNSGKTSSATSATLSQSCGAADRCEVHAESPVKGSASSSVKQTTGQKERLVQKSKSLELMEAPSVDESTGKESRELARSAKGDQFLEHASVSTGEEAEPLPEHEPAAEMVNSNLKARHGAVEDTQTADVVEPQDDWVAEGDLTLVNDVSEELPLSGKASPLRDRKVPPLPGPPSSHSSTSADPESSSESPVPTSEAEEMEWEASLQPHQRALHDLLIRVSNRVLRHIVDNETAVADVAGDFASDSQHLLHEVLKRHHAMYAEVREDMETKRTALRKELEKSAKALAKERRRVSAVA